MKRIGIITAVVVIGLTALALAASDVKFHPAYPGKFSIKGHTAWYNVAQESVGLGAMMYYSVFERWPKSWKEVQDSGIFQRDLFGPEFQHVDPDDKRLDFYYDVVYEYREGQDPLVHSFAKTISSSPLTKPVTYRERLTRIAKDYPNFNADYWLSDSHRLVQLAIAFQLQNAIRRVTSSTGKMPRTREEVLSSGYSPISETSLNPTTGRPFRFDGSANDFSYQGNVFIPVDAYGSKSSVWGYW